MRYRSLLSVIGAAVMLTTMGNTAFGQGVCCPSLPATDSTVMGWDEATPESQFPWDTGSPSTAYTTYTTKLASVVSQISDMALSQWFCHNDGCTWGTELVDYPILRSTLGIYKEQLTREYWITLQPPQDTPTYPFDYLNIPISFTPVTPVPGDPGYVIPLFPPTIDLTTPIVVTVPPLFILDPGTSIPIYNPCSGTPSLLGNCQVTIPSQPPIRVPGTPPSVFPIDEMYEDLIRLIEDWFHKGMRDAARYCYANGTFSGNLCDAATVNAAAALFDAEVALHWNDYVDAMDLWRINYNHGLNLPGCIADWNEDGGVDGSDVSDFYTSWGNGQADVNLDGGTDGDDVTAWFDMYYNNLCW